jgi:hypothetical protein
VVIGGCRGMLGGMTDVHSDLQKFVETYMSLWNEPDPDVRSKLIRELWAPTGGQVLVDPPQEVREAAGGLSFPVPPLEVHGYEQLEARVTRAYEMFIAPGEYVFSLGTNISRLLDHVITFDWKMKDAKTGDAVGGGVDVVELDEDGRIQVGYQFIER